MEQQILDFFAQYVYQPYVVYAAIFGFMSICAMGVPIPEEFIIISAGLVGHMALNPQEYPPPYPGASAADPYTLAAVTFISVIATDYFIYSMGKFFGHQIIYSQRFKKYFPEDKMTKVRAWAQKYGFFAPGIFRFIPGVRFPGHLMCGALGVKTWIFLLVDGGAALFSVPTQVLLVSFYGRDILMKIKPFKIYFFAAIVLFVAFYVVRKYFFERKLSTP
ncbi:VTT domain-containing protein [bacterium]|nr:VTT domain-containing protein [bacterium]